VGADQAYLLDAGRELALAEATAAASPEASVRPLASRRPVRLVIAAALPIAILVAWQLTTSLGWFTVVQLPPPAMVWSAAVDLFERGLLVKYLAISTQRVVVGFAIGASLGLVMGAITGLSRTWDLFFGSTLGAIRAVPSLAWVPLLLLWLKIGEESKVTLITIGAFFPVFTTVSLALRHVDRNLVEAGQAFGLSGIRLFATVQLPQVLPAVISGLRLALAQSWLFLVAAELIAASAGLGFLLTDSANNGRVDRILLAIVLLAIILLGLIGKATDSLLGIFERWASRRWT
jgi:sulfonate transport system permease protein